MKESILAVTIIAFSMMTQVQASLANKIKAYENSPKVVKTLRYMRKKKRAKSAGLCAKYVRLGYMHSGMIHTHPGIEYAKNYTPYFNESKWKNLVTDSSFKPKLVDNLFNTPSGCAVVYEAINPKYDRNGYIGHIETRIRHGKPWGFISDYFSANPRTGLKCARTGAKSKKLKVFTAKKSSPYHKGGKRVKVYINTTSCKTYTSKGAYVSDEFKNRRVIGVHCKF